MKILFIVICCLLLFTGCANTSQDELQNYEKTNSSTVQDNDMKESDVKVSEVKVMINDKVYTLTLEENNTVEEFISLLPKEFTMNELNGNEKYVYMDVSLSTNSYLPKHIEKGDVMLYGDNCLVLFYKSFESSYRYTKIGHIDDLEDLGNGSITARFENR